MSSLERTVEILKTLAAGPSVGMRLQDLAEATGVARPTVHRLLGQMRELRLVDQDPLSERYSLGLDLYLLGQTAARRFDLLELAKPVMEDLAETIGDTIYLTLRHRTESICIWRTEGSYPIKVLTSAIGQSQPLGLGVGSICLLSYLPDDDTEQILKQNRRLLEQNSHFDLNTLLSVIERAKQNGYVLSRSVMVDGISALGVPIVDWQGRPIAAISVTAIDERLRGDRLAFVIEHCRKGVAVLQNHLALRPR
jgi:DNA-binding IclR family transcriptional regulator